MDECVNKQFHKLSAALAESREAPLRDRSELQRSLFTFRRALDPLLGVLASLSFLPAPLTGAAGRQMSEFRLMPQAAGRSRLEPGALGGD